MRAVPRSASVPEPPRSATQSPERASAPLASTVPPASWVSPRPLPLLLHGPLQGAAPGCRESRVLVPGAGPWPPVRGTALEWPLEEPQLGSSQLRSLQGLCWSLAVVAFVLLSLAEVCSQPVLSPGQLSQPVAEAVQASGSLLPCPSLALHVDGCSVSPGLTCQQQQLMYTRQCSHLCPGCSFSHFPFEP